MAGRYQYISTHERASVCAFNSALPHTACPWRRTAWAPAQAAFLPASRPIPDPAHQVFWRRAAAAGGAPRWLQSAPLALRLPAPLERADVVAAHGAALRVLAVAAGAAAPSAAVLAVTGDPTCVDGTGAAAREPACVNGVIIVWLC